VSGRPLWAGQQVPRPPETRPGAPAPWDDLPLDLRQRWTVEEVRSVLDGAGMAGPPFGDAEVGSDPPVVVRDARVPNVATRPSAVLLALFEDRGTAEARVILTRRSTALRAHTGQVSFPGGRIEPGEDAAAAAAREAWEEVGLDRGAVAPIGWLRRVHTVASGSLITPVVARLPGRPTLAANPAEVARVFDVALADLMAPGVFSEEIWVVRAQNGDRDAPAPHLVEFPVTFYDLGDELVWGATARILTDLLALLHAARCADAP